MECFLTSSRIFWASRRFLRGRDLTLEFIGMAALGCLGFVSGSETALFSLDPNTQGLVVAQLTVWCGDCCKQNIGFIDDSY